MKTFLEWINENKLNESFVMPRGGGSLHKKIFSYIVNPHYRNISPNNIIMSWDEGVVEHFVALCTQEYKEMKHNPEFKFEGQNEQTLTENDIELIIHETLNKHPELSPMAEELPDETPSPPPPVTNPHVIRLKNMMLRSKRPRQ